MWELCRDNVIMFSDYPSDCKCDTEEEEKISKTKKHVIKKMLY